MNILFPGRLSTASVTVVALFVAACASTTPAPVVERGVTPSQTAATTPVAPPVVVPMYTVKKGDTLLSIALDHGVDHKDLAAWNMLDNPNRILIGQQLRTTPPQPIVSESQVAVVQPVGMAGAVVERRSLDGNTDSLKREPKAGKVAYSDEVWAKANTAAPVDKIEAKPLEAKPAELPSKSESKPEAAGDPAWTWPGNGKMLLSYNGTTSKGVDISGKEGEPVLAAAAGKVTLVTNTLPAYGNLVVVKHDDKLISVYAHSQTVLVKEGQAVSRGQKIAEVGRTGTGVDQPKLHFEIRLQGKPVDPLKYLPAR
jgi:lipoprotein NlpD